ncbi:MAG: amidohydrolase family protein [Planctomycetes bacterium]|nr:amidohydrolase family protein [Planctomycetota bacterium]
MALFSRVAGASGVQRVAAFVAAAACSVAVARAQAAERVAIVAAKVLVASWEGQQVVDRGVVLVNGAKIEAVGPVGSIPIPAGTRVIDVGERWVMPGMVDLHSHVGGPGGDINDMVFQCNPELRASSAVVPSNRLLDRGLSAGVTTVLFIPGSGTNIGGQGILVKTSPQTFDEMRIREPGSLKIAQGDNPTRWGYGMGRMLMNHHIRDTLEKGRAYATAWERYEKGEGVEPEKQLELEVFRDLFGHRTQISTHTQMYRLVLSTISLMRGEFGLDVYIDHGEWAGYVAAPLAVKMGVPAIVGPREIDALSGRTPDTEGKVISVSAEYQRRGPMQVGFNTDAPVVPQEELFLQASMGVRYGFENDAMEAVRGLTIVPARTAGIAERVGSLEVGKDADLVVVGGDPTDPRNGVELVMVEGRVVYDVSVDGRRF